MNSGSPKLPTWVADDGTDSIEQTTLLRGLLRQVRRPLAIGVLAAVATMTASAIVPWLIGRTIDYLTSTGRTPSGLALRCLTLAAIIAFGALLGMVQQRSDTRLRLETSLRAMTLVNHQSIRLGGRPQGRAAGEVINLGIGDVMPIGGGIAGLTRGIGGLASILVVSVVLLTLSWQLFLLVILGAVVLLRVNGLFLRPYAKTQRTMQERMGELTAIALDATSGIRVIKGLGATERFADRYREKSQQVRTAAAMRARVGSVVAGSQSLATGVLSTATVWFAATLAASGTISIGDFVAAYGYATFLTMPVPWVFASHQQWTAAKESAHRISSYLAVRAADRTGSVDAKGSEHQSTTVLDSESGLSAPIGHYTVIASTDTIDWATLAEKIRGVHPNPQQVLVVPADDYLFSGALISVLDPWRRADQAAIDRAVHAAALQDVIDPLPDGLAHVVTAGGTDFSGGEQQRIRLARALLATSQTLVLVEPTNALDATTEVEVAGRLRHHRAGCTTVLLTNSTPHLVQADHIVLLRDGEVLATGTHASLLERTDYQLLVERSGALS